MPALWFICASTESLTTSHMKQYRYLVPTAALLVTILAFHLGADEDRLTTGSASQSARYPESTKPNFSRPRDEASLATKGMLWEAVASNPRERAVKSIPISADSFSGAMTGNVGEAVTLRMANSIPALRAEIKGRNTAADGTVLTHLRVPGEPEAQLTIQENAEMDFFLAQLYYDNHPVAYEFRESDDGMTATRHELSDLICSTIDHKAMKVTNMGLPPMGGGSGAASDEMEVSAIIGATRKPSAAAAALPTLSVADVSIIEGNSGSKSLSFTVRLSKANTSKSTSFRYATANGTATSGTDFTSASGSVSISRGRTSATVKLTIFGDTTVEPNETFLLNLSSPTNATFSDAQAVGTITNDDTASGGGSGGGTTPPSGGVPVFNSLPGAVAVIYLDMDGQVVTGTQWKSGATITARGVVGTLSDAQMLEVCRRIAEDYSPFEINVTTQETAYLAAPANRRIRCIITPDNEWYGNAGGIAYVNSFSWTGDTPCWVFSDMLYDSPRYIADSASHEIGHTLSLLHDGRISPSEGYYQGHGSGEVGWAPIMGVGYYKNLSQWSKGEYLSASNKENDLSLITSLTNGFGYRTDLVGNDTASATPLTIARSARSASGIIETPSDVDVFSFNTAGGSCSFTALGDPNGQNLDILVEILGASGLVIASANPDTLTDATVTASLPAGNYFLRVSGVGRGNASGDGYTDFGSLGQYTISGNAQ